MNARQRHGKNLRMAQEMVNHAPKLPRGYRVAVVGNTHEHAEELVRLVRELAKAQGIDVSHIDWRPIGGDAIAAHERARGKH